MGLWGGGASCPEQDACPVSRLEPRSARRVALAELFTLSGPDTLVAVLLGKR